MGLRLRGPSPYEEPEREEEHSDLSDEYAVFGLTGVIVAFHAPAVYSVLHCRGGGGGEQEPGACGRKRAKGCEY